MQFLTRQSCLSSKFIVYYLYLKEIFSVFSKLSTLIAMLVCDTWLKRTVSEGRWSVFFFFLSLFCRANYITAKLQACWHYASLSMFLNSVLKILLFGVWICILRKPYYIFFKWRNVSVSNLLLICQSDCLNKKSICIFLLCEIMSYKNKSERIYRNCSNLLY